MPHLWLRARPLRSAACRGSLLRHGAPKATMPVARLAVTMRHGENANMPICDRIDHAIGETTRQAATCSARNERPPFRPAQNTRNGCFHGQCELPTQTRPTPLVIIDGLVQLLARSGMEREAHVRNRALIAEKTCSPGMTSTFPASSSSILRSASSAQRRSISSRSGAPRLSSNRSTRNILSSQERDNACSTSFIAADVIEPLSPCNHSRSRRPVNPATRGNGIRATLLDGTRKVRGEQRAWAGGSRRCTARGLAHTGRLPPRRIMCPEEGRRKRPSRRVRETAGRAARISHALEHGARLQT